MNFTFYDLTEKIRESMLEEFIEDERNGNLFISRRIKESEPTIQKYFELLTESFKNGTDFTLSEAIKANNILKETEQYRKNGVLKLRKVASNASEVLGQGEFRRYYMRALCKQAILEYKDLVIYRGRKSNEKSLDAELVIGKQVNPEKLLEYLKINPENITDELQYDNSPEYRMLRVNTGLCIKFV